MILTQNFSTDFDLITAGLRKGYSGAPYAFVRFGDGEEAIMRGREHIAKSDGWKVPAGDHNPTGRAGALYMSLRFDLPGFYLGITASEHHPDCHRWLMDRTDCLLEKISYAEIFIFANYSRFRAIDISRCTICAPSGHVTVPADAIMTGWDQRHVVDYLIDNVRNPILVAAGPVANIIIHDYWLRCPPERKRVILDVGSALDQQTRGRRTRRYQHATSPLAKWTPRFWPADEVLTDSPASK